MNTDENTKPADPPPGEPAGYFSIRTACPPPRWKSMDVVSHAIQFAFSAPVVKRELDIIIQFIV